VNAPSASATHEASANGERPIYLTFDDGPDPEWTPRILDALAHAGAVATFFVIGSAARREPALLRRAVAEGHLIGNHTWSHRHPWTMLPRAARSEVRQGADVIEDIVGTRARWYRAPHGRNRACMTHEAHACGQTMVNWHLSAIDWGPLGIADRIEARLTQSRAGQILLMHDGRNQHNRPEELLKVLPHFLGSLGARRLRASAL
jgi:peptidoglycan/xylan/chitin deacetylase (PgdA/CDA1 family)